MEWGEDLDCKVMNRTSVILFGRLPVPGKVKTRLAKAIGDRAACDIYKEMCENIVSQVVKSTASLVFMCADKEDVAPCKEWLAPLAQPSWRQIAVRPQVEGDLGERITAAFIQAFDDGCDEVIVAGTDVPDLSIDTFTLAFLHLQSFNVVIGPSNDDGYYLIGLKRNVFMEESGHKDRHEIVRKLFKGIHWSTSLVYRDQVSTAYKLELSVTPYKCLPVLIDIDTAADAELWLERVANNPNINRRLEKRKAEARKPSFMGGISGDSQQSLVLEKNYYKVIFDKLKVHFPHAAKAKKDGQGSLAANLSAAAPSISWTIAESLKRILTSPPKRTELPKDRRRSQIAKQLAKRLEYEDQE